ncbi:hypothetical protein NXV31_16565 [Bacteroides fragilis]|nr:hypothetical protein [Bacteroides fragilis]UVP14511.1 hypothetical protein NXY24_15650 [Bacteroides fragilis]UVP84498.1 hypothetical protein NXV54_15440 [Bacteroides fragilis]
MTKKGDKIENIKTVIRRHLQKADVYAPELSYQIELAASDILLYRKLREKALSEDTPITVKEYSRENKPREKINPVFAAMKEQADVVRRDLRSLYMNRELKRNEKAKENESDPLEEMMKKLNEIDKEDIGTGQ